MPRFACHFLYLWLSFGLTCLALPIAAAVPQGPEICETAAIQAARATGVPLSVLRAISLTETGRKYQGEFRPWPWTVNMEGKGMWFDDRAQALAYAQENFDRGARSFDVGCFQINYKWHNQAFASIEQMFDPLANALYAAEFLLSLYGEKGDWGAAAGAYHSRNAKYADGYQARFEKIRARFSAQDGSPLPDVSDALLAAAAGGVDPATRREVIRVNTFPLLQAGAQGSLGSLMPVDAAAGQSLAVASGGARGLLAQRPDRAAIAGDPTIPEISPELAAALDASDAPDPDPGADPPPVSEPGVVNLGAIY